MGRTPRFNFSYAIELTPKGPSDARYPHSFGPGNFTYKCLMNPRLEGAESWNIDLENCEDVKRTSESKGYKRCQNFCENENRKIPRRL
ncbi:uncharacterized protein LOC128250543 isoform X2 [Octopus bimaculoides]|uniref:uncharacterized protein LOC128250543 isoform X2 n=1 Tax=Octopus bimaculoides TaxID=37653 RepID=UPI0022E559F1|nr:uncharacterized protein LOC128250543 isoform X2 [Octopus bimaculoides]